MSEDDNSKSKPVLGYIGMGIMGAPMTANLLKAGYEVHVWNRSPGKALPVLEIGATFQETPAAIAEVADVIFINVTDTPDVEALVFGESGIASGISEGKVLIDNSTISPGGTRDMAARLWEDKQAYWLDAPVSGGDIGAINGTLSVMVGGDQQVFEACLPLLEVVGGKVTYLGAVGSGQACKACNQILCTVHMVALCEAMGLAVKEGLELEKMLAVTTAGAGGSWALQHLGAQVAEGDMKPGFMVDYLLKDLGIVEKACAEHGIDLSGMKLGQSMLKEASDMGFGRAGTQATSQVYEKLLGVDYYKAEED